MVEAPQIVLGLRGAHSSGHGEQRAKDLTSSLDLHLSYHSIENELPGDLEVGTAVAVLYVVLRAGEHRVSNEP